MNAKTPSSPEQSAPHSDVERVYSQLIANGADPLHHDFSMALGDQKEVVFEGIRLLLTGQVDNQTLQAVPGFYDARQQQIDRVTAFEIPRDSRTMLQVANSAGNETIANTDVFARFGQVIHELMQHQNLIPDAQQLDLGAVVFVRTEDQFFLNPAIGLVSASPDAISAANETLYAQLLPAYETHGGADMMNAYLGAQA